MARGLEHTAHKLVSQPIAFCIHQLSEELEKSVTYEYDNLKINNPAVQVNLNNYFGHIE